MWSKGWCDKLIQIRKHGLRTDTLLNENEWDKNIIICNKTCDTSVQRVDRIANQYNSNPAFKQEKYIWSCFSRLCDRYPSVSKHSHVRNIFSKLV